ncbi:Ubiquitin carboxyl-terminal hydrolase 17-like protein B [Frankliniella fusca]|uniref:Ubiquitin carboxyl-terminal hydrolase 17-like protein B n=1 Tax=Frankliniella fusca TaxID=407009 RepID=A0AAE1GX75_9NEOP|nr:Ubiquitin carboxyl-terminal hydrolase 17-like protein B [Frankliniella fusca]
MASDIMANCDIGAWETLPHSDVGIKNLSPNGGLNASLQLLLHTPSFIALVLTAHDTCNQVCLWCTIRNIISDMKNKRRGDVLSISEDFLSSFFGGFGGEPLPYLEKIFCHLTHNLRDKFSNEGVKRTFSVHLDMNLQLSSGASYKFAGCILHEGESRAAGQYMTLARCPSGSFTLLIDAQVKAVRRESLLVDKSLPKKIVIAMYNLEGKCENEKQSFGEDARNNSVHSWKETSFPWEVQLDDLNTSAQSIRSTHGTWTETSFPWEVQLESSFQSSKAEAAFPGEVDLNLSIRSNHSATWLVTKNVGIGELSISLEDQQKTGNELREIMDHSNSINSNFSTSFMQNDDNLDTYYGSDTSYESILQLEEPQPKKKVACRVLDLDFTDEEKEGRISGLPPTLAVKQGLVRYDVCKTMAEEDFKFFTGLSQCNYEVLFEVMGGDSVIRKLKYEFKEKTPQKLMPQKLSSRDRLFMMLVRMRRGVPFRDLSYIFGISVTQCCVIFNAMIRTTYECLSSFKKAIFTSG